MVIIDTEPRLTPQEAARECEWEQKKEEMRAPIPTTRELTTIPHKRDDVWDNVWRGIRDSDPEELEHASLGEYADKPPTKLNMEAALRDPKMSGWKFPETEMEMMRVENCHPAIQINVRHLAKVHNIKQAFIARCAVEKGLAGLRHLKDLGRYVALAEFWAAEGDDVERNLPMAGSFDMAEGKKPFWFRCRKVAVEGCGQFAADLGLNKSTVYQLALMLGLSSFQLAYSRDKITFSKNLFEFAKWLHEAIDRMARYVPAAKGRPRPPEWDSVIEVDLAAIEANVKLLTEGPKPEPSKDAVSN
jgi:hypothetical protein